MQTRIHTYTQYTANIMNLGFPYFGAGGVDAYGDGAPSACAHDAGTYGAGAPEAGALSVSAHGIGTFDADAHVVGAYNFGAHG